VSVSAYDKEIRQDVDTLLAAGLLTRSSPVHLGYQLINYYVDQCSNITGKSERKRLESKIEAVLFRGEGFGGFSNKTVTQKFEIQAALAAVRHLGSATREFYHISHVSGRPDVAEHIAIVQTSINAHIMHKKYNTYSSKGDQVRHVFNGDSLDLPTRELQEHGIKGAAALISFGALRNEHQNLYNTLNSMAMGSLIDPAERGQIRTAEYASNGLDAPYPKVPRFGRYNDWNWGMIVYYVLPNSLLRYAPEYLRDSGDYYISADDIDIDPNDTGTSRPLLRPHGWLHHDVDPAVLQSGDGIQSHVDTAIFDATYSKLAFEGQPQGTYVGRDYHTHNSTLSPNHGELNINGAPQLTPIHFFSRNVDHRTGRKATTFHLFSYRSTGTNGTSPYDVVPIKLGCDEIRTHDGKTEKIDLIHIIQSMFYNDIWRQHGLYLMYLLTGFDGVGTRG
jgi:hypothetical protein